MSKTKTWTAETIAVGSELLLGGRLDTNSLFIADRLAACGIELRYKTTVGDDLSDIARRARILLEEYEREGQRDAHEASRRAERMADPDRLL